MAKLTTKERNSLRTSAFALPKTRGWPVHDKSHARFALTQVGRSLRAGNITPAQAAAIRYKANARLGRR